MADEEKPKVGVVIDFTGWSVDTKTDVTFRVQYDGLPLGKGGTYEGGEGFDPETFAFAYEELLKTAGVQVERFEKTKVRILGFEQDGKFHPAVNATVTSRTLPQNLLPKVVIPPKPKLPPDKK